MLLFMLTNREKGNNIKVRFYESVNKRWIYKKLILSFTNKLHYFSTGR